MKAQLALALLFLAAATASAQSTAFTYQGHLMDGGASANGNYDIQFTLKNALTAGATVGAAQTISPVNAVNGIFTVTLDFGFTPFDGSDRWVELGVRPFGSAVEHTVLAPRQRLTATPYAIKALSAVSLIDNGAGLTGVAANMVGGVSAADVAKGANLANAATVANTPSTIVKRDANGNISVGSITVDRLVVSGTEPTANVFPVQGMAWIKPGTFIMGSRAAVPGQPEEQLRFPDEGPQRMVTLSKGFWMGVHEVTQAEYQTVMGRNPSIFTGDTRRPVEMVSWYDAVAYCTTLTTTERAAGQIPADWGYRLPTEAEWEYCCRAGARTTRFGYGDDLGSTSLLYYGWFQVNSGGSTQPVEHKLANAWGLMDMHGNLWEWCHDNFDTYPAGSVTDPQGPASGFGRVIRGGCWSSTHAAGYLRSARRVGQNPYNGRDYTGFRVVLSSGQP